jgi:uncharacterized protein YqhQ
MEDRLIAYGGQAVLEGVMMRGKRAAAVAMRAPDGQIVTHVEKLAGIYQSRLAKIPFLRGLILLWDALGLGMRALTISANTQTGEDEKIEGKELVITLVVSLALGIGLFFVLPATIGGLAERYLLNGSAPLSSPAPTATGSDSSPAAAPGAVASQRSPVGGVWWGNAIEGLLRLLLLIGYVWAVGFIPEIKRVYSYHGAEHKTINAYEAGADLTPENVARYPIAHARCGTAFLLTLVLLSILVFTLMGPLPLLWRIVTRIVFIPILAGIAYEYIKWTGSHLDSPFVQAIIRPNLALQRLTTHEPDLKMLEVAITSFQTMRKVEEEMVV